MTIASPVSSAIQGPPVCTWDTIPDQGFEAADVSQFIAQQLAGDWDPYANLGTFATISMEPEADHLLMQTINKNLIDQYAYPGLEEIHQQVIAMLSELFNTAPEGIATGMATVGSSEAIMLGLLAHKFAWRARRQRTGQSTDRPNIVMGSHVHVCWHKFARFFDVEARILPAVDERCILTADQVADAIDENTIAVGAVLGNTFTGRLDEIESINRLLTRVKRDRGWDIPIHVDAASGGFVLPFTHPELLWDFRLDQVKTINVSNHKFGLIYPGMGALLFRDPSALPEELIFDVSYTGGCLANFSLNFSRPGAMVVLQYYNFLRHGKAGYRDIVVGALDNARYLEAKLRETCAFDVLSDTEYLPIVAPYLNTRRAAVKSVTEISQRLRKRGWVVPAYPLPGNGAERHVLRMVVKQDWTPAMTDALIRDIRHILAGAD
ncbi:MAG TPA: glutamate decarboxylase [Chthonomonadaceae bacterium]|nr:glutamate decarboxylase [Chthonomonadaceae bacterium]